MEPRSRELPEYHDEPEFSHAKFAYFSVIVIFLAYQFAGQALVSLLARDGTSAKAALIQGLGQTLFMLIPAVVVMQYSPLRVHGLMRFGGSVTAAQWAIGLAGVFAVQTFAAGFASVQEMFIPEQWYPWYKKAGDALERIYQNLLGGSTPLDAARALIVGAVIPAFSEEILFRGVMQRSLERVRSPRKAIIITACIFGILHLNPILAIPLIVTGAYLGFLAYYTQSLALPIVAHFLNNAFAIVMLYAPEPADAPEVGAVAEVTVLLVGAAGIALAMFLMLKTTRTLPVQEQVGQSWSDAKNTEREGTKGAESNEQE